MTTKNLSSSSFKGKVNGQRLPPIPVTNEQPNTTTITTTGVTNSDYPTSILKKSKPITDNVTNEDHKLPLNDDDGKILKKYLFYSSELNYFPR